MGYYINTVQSTARIPERNVPRALEALDEIDPTHLPRWFRKTPSQNGWITGSPLTDFVECMRSIGFEDTDYDKDTKKVYISGYSAKAGWGEEYVLDAIAPFTEGAIEWSGEEGERWVGIFKDGKYLTQSIVGIDLSDYDDGEWE